MSSESLSVVVSPGRVAHTFRRLEYMRNVTEAEQRDPDIYFVCSTGCPGGGETDALQFWTYNGVPLPSPNGVVYKCGSITVNGN